MKRRQGGEKGPNLMTAGRMDRGDGIELAWEKQEGRGPTIVFLPGFRSDMTGDKATGLAEIGRASCRERVCVPV